MRLTAKRDVLAAAISAAARSLPSRPVTPVAAALQLDVLDNDRLLVVGTDVESTTKCVVALESSEKGRVLVHGAVLADLLRDLPEGPVTLSVADGTMTITATCGTYKMQVITGDPIPAPKLPDVIGSVDAAALLRAATSVVTATDRTDANLSAVKLELHDGQIRIIGTDRYRLGLASVDFTPAEGVTVSVTSVNVFAKHLLDAVRVFGKHGEIRISLGDGVIGLSNPTTAIITRLAASQFPKYEALLTKDPLGSVTVDAESLVGAVKRVGRFGSNRVQVGFNAEAVTVTCPSGEIGTATETIPGGWSGESELTVTVNSAYLADAVNATGADSVTLSPTGSSSAMKVAGSENDPFHLVMPMRG
jgi:DNA polymerase-3 subunit beta